MLTKDRPYGLGVSRVIAKQSRRNPHIDRRDLEQQAALTMLEVERAGHVASAPDPIRYMAAAVRNSLIRMAITVRCPVHGRLDEMIRCQISNFSDFDVSEKTPSPEDAIDRARALAEIRRVLDAASPAAKAVILEERKPADVAREFGLTAKQVYWQTEKARDAVRARLEEMVRE